MDPLSLPISIVPISRQAPLVIQTFVPSPPKPMTLIVLLSVLISPPIKRDAPPKLLAITLLENVPPKPPLVPLPLVLKLLKISVLLTTPLVNLLPVKPLLALLMLTLKLPAQVSIPTLLVKAIPAVTSLPMLESKHVASMLKPVLSTTTLAIQLTVLPPINAKPRVLLVLVVSRVHVMELVPGMTLLKFVMILALPRPMLIVPQLVN